MIGWYNITLVASLYAEPCDAHTLYSIDSLTNGRSDGRSNENKTSFVRQITQSASPMLHYHEMAAGGITRWLDEKRFEPSRVVHRPIIIALRSISRLLLLLLCP